MAPRECGRLFRVTFQRVVPANAGTHTARTLVLALAQRPFFTFEARGDGSLRSQGRLAESSCEATIASTRGSYAIPLPASGRGELNPWTYRFNHKLSCSGSCARPTRRRRLADDCEKAYCQSARSRCRPSFASWRACIDDRQSRELVISAHSGGNTLCQNIYARLAASSIRSVRCRLKIA